MCRSWFQGRQKKETFMKAFLNELCEIICDPFTWYRLAVALIILAAVVLIDTCTQGGGCLAWCPVLVSCPGVSLGVLGDHLHPGRRRWAGDAWAGARDGGRSPLELFAACNGISAGIAAVARRWAERHRAFSSQGFLSGRTVQGHCMVARSHTIPMRNRLIQNFN